MKIIIPGNTQKCKQLTKFDDNAQVTKPASSLGSKIAFRNWFSVDTFSINSFRDGWNTK